MITRLTERNNYRASQIIILAISQLCLYLIFEKYTLAL